MNWNNMPLAHKIATIISGIAAVVWLLQMAKPDLLPLDLGCPAIAVFTVCEAVVYWQKKRVWAYLLIAGSVISTAIFILELMLK